jgi:hypothetical protein
MFTREQLKTYVDVKFPYGQIGSKLWVRETWRLAYGGVRYKADDNFWILHKWKPSIHMFRFMSRITLEITDIRVQRLQEISEEDAVSEGTPINDFFPVNTAKIVGLNAVDYYAELWDSLNGKKHPWASNPWVWAINFKRSIGIKGEE